MRRAALLAGVVALGAGAVFAGPAWTDDQGGRVACDRTLVAANRGPDGGTEIALYDGDDVRPLTPGWVTASPSFSPDGQHVVFVRGDAGWADAGPSTTELWIAAVREGAEEPRNLLRSEGLRYDPAWSPAGDRIAYVEQAGGNRVVRIVAPDGSDPATVLEETGAESLAPAWSPDGSELAYIERRPGESSYSYDIGILDLDAGDSTTIAEHATKATLAGGTTVFYLDRVRPAMWQLAVGHLDGERLVHERHIGSDEIYNYGHFGLDAARCAG